MKKFNLTAAKKGAASIYVVVFATILFGVITLSFMRIILSESSQTSNDDLSQSAYDAAMAGVEDAKIAVNKYYQCKSAGFVSSECQTYQTLFENQDCASSKLPTILYGLDGGDEVKITESLNAGTSSNNTDQAYTCVLLSNKVDDYRSTLSSDTRTRVVPLGIGSQSLVNVKYVEFSWYSELNGTSETFNLNKDGLLHPKNDTTIPPTISLSLIRTGSSFSVSEFNNSTSTNFSTMILLPSSNNANGGNTTINQTEIKRAASTDEGQNSPFNVNCTGQNGFACTVRLGGEDGLGLTAGGNAMLVISLPYGDTITDFAVTLYNGEGSPIPFENVQVSVDSTGRTNQLVRRVETRLDPADVYFPYPQYEVELSSDKEDAFVKNFWITANCWTENGTCDNNKDLSND